MRLKVGDKAPNFDETDVNGVLQSMSDGKHPTLLSFHRHAGCPPCNLRVREHMLAKQDLDRYGVRILGIFESPVESIRSDLAHKDVPFPILADSERRLYQMYSVKPSLKGFIKSFLIKPLYSIKAIFKHHYIPKFSEATTMMPAEFLIAPDGTILLTKYAENFGDYLFMSDIYTELENL